MPIIFVVCTLAMWQACILLAMELMRPIERKLMQRLDNCSPGRLCVFPNRRAIVLALLFED